MIPVNIEIKEDYCEGIETHAHVQDKGRSIAVDVDYCDSSATIRLNLHKDTAIRLVASLARALEESEREYCHYHIHKYGMLSVPCLQHLGSDAYHWQNKVDVDLFKLMHAVDDYQDGDMCEICDREIAVSRDGEKNE